MKVHVSYGKTTAPSAGRVHKSPQICAHSGIGSALNHRTPVDGALSFVPATWDNSQQDTTTAKRPRINGAPTPNRGLADRKDTTD